MGKPSDLDYGTLQHVWMEVLGIDQFDCNEDFFVSGGDSLKATTLMTAIEERFDLIVEEIEVLWAPRFDDFYAQVQAIAAETRAMSESD